MKSKYLLVGLASLATPMGAQQKCEQLPGYDLCKLSDLKHILTIKPIIFTDGLSRGLDSSALADWTKVVDSVGAYISKNHAELNKEFNQLRAISDGLVNTVKIARNAQSSADKQKVVDAFFANKELFKKTPDETLATIRKDLAPGAFSRHKDTRELLMDLAQALRTAIELIKSDAPLMQKNAVLKDLGNLRRILKDAHTAVENKNGDKANQLVSQALSELERLKGSLNPSMIEERKKNLQEALVDINRQNWGPAGRFIVFTVLKLNEIK